MAIDDEEAIRDILVRLLSPDGHTVECFASAEEALGHVQASAHDIILLDLRIPGIDGRQFYERVRDTSPGLAGKIVFLTGDTMSPDTHQFISSTGNISLSKPFRREDLRKVIFTVAQRTNTGK
ncbi:MAG: response regulator [SAR202 cluster bacterium]|nr:response regulator [SAR202 cluster bacterium]